MAEESKPIVVVGGGLSGCCIALLLSKLFPNDNIILIEARDDYRKELKRINEASKARGLGTQFDNAARRSINLALSHRGICALKACGIYSDILKQEMLILMKGRYVHLGDGKTSEQLYGQDHQGIYSISRLTLNCLFLDKLSAASNVEIKFQCKVSKISRDGTVYYMDNNADRQHEQLYKDPLIDNAIDSRFVLGCDGVYSAVRGAMQRLGRYNFRINYIDHGYKELTIFPVASDDGKGMDFRILDCLILYEKLKEGVSQKNLDSEKIFDAFSAHRQPSAEALSQLSLQNYVEMRSLTAQKWFVYKKKLEKALNYYAPTVWRPLYSMVAFSRTPYNEASQRAKTQDRYLSIALSSFALISAATVAITAQKYSVRERIASSFNKK